MSSLRFWICGLLWITLGLQAFYTLILLQGPHYPAPKILIHWIERSCREKGFRCEFTGLWIDAHGGITCDNLCVFKDQNPKPIAGAQRIHLSPHWLQILLGQWKPKRLQIQNGFIAPSVHQKVLIHQIQFKGQGFAWGWNIDSLSAYARNHRLQAKGQFISLLSKHQPNLRSGSVNWNDTIGVIEKFIDCVQKGDLSLHFYRSNIAQTLVNAQWSADRLEDPALPITLSRVFTEGKFLLSSHGIEPQGAFFIQGENLNYQEKPYAPFLRGAVHFEKSPHSAFTPMLKSAECFAPSLVNLEFPIERAWLKFQRNSQKEWESQTALFHQNSWAIAQTPLDTLLSLKSKELPPKGHFPILQGHLYPETLKALAPFIEPLQDLSQLPEIIFKGFYCFDHNQNKDECKIYFKGNALQWKTIQLEKLYGIFVRQPSEWGLESFEAAHKSGNVTGSIKIFPHQQYAIDLKGNLNPTLLNPYLPDWWSSIWPPLEFQNAFPHADLRIFYEENNPVYFHVHGSISGEKLHYHKVYFDTFKTQLKAFPEKVDLGPFKATVKSKEATGTVSWILNSELEKTIFQVKSNLPIDCYKIFSPATSLVEAFNPESCPHLTAQGERIEHLEYPLELSINLDSPEPITVKGLELDNLHFHCSQHEQTITIDPLDIGLANGKINGKATINLNNPDNHLFEFELNANDLQLEYLQREFPLLNKIQMQPILSRSATPAQTAGPFGLVDAFITGKGPLNQPEMMDANGFIHLKASAQPNTLLGIKFYTHNFTKPFDDTDVNSKDLFIQELYAPLKINNGIFFIREGWISGPTSRIIANGSCNLSTQAIDFTFSMQPFREVPLLAAAFLPLRPLTQAFKMRLTGTLMHPEIGK